MNVVYSPYSSNPTPVQPWTRHDFKTFFQRMVISFPFICVGIAVVAFEPVLFFISKVQVASWHSLFSAKIATFGTLQTAQAFIGSSVFSEVLYGALAGLMITLLRFVHFRFYSPHRMTTVPDSFVSALFCRELFTQGWKFVPLLLLNTATGILISTSMSTMGCATQLTDTATPIFQLALGVPNGGGPNGPPALSVLSLIVILLMVAVLIGIFISLILHLAIAWPMILMASIREATTSTVIEIYAGRSSGSLGNRLFSALKQGLLAGICSGVIAGIFQSARVAVALSAFATPLETLFLVLSVPWSLSLIFNTYLYPEKVKSSFQDLFRFLKEVFEFVFALVLYLVVGGTVIYWLNSC